MNLETDNPDKGQLLQRSAHHRELLEEEVKLITEKSERIITNALIIGGALALTYLLFSNFSGSGKKEKVKAKKAKSKKAKSDVGMVEPDAEVEAEQTQEAGFVSQIGSLLMAQATGFLLSIAREKLVEFLQSQTAKKDNTDEHP